MRMGKAMTLDGRTGEGGGQLVRIACALAAVSSEPICITKVRGNRQGRQGGGTPSGIPVFSCARKLTLRSGLKSQHVSSIEWLARATDADASGISVGSHDIEFRPKLKPWDLRERKIRIVAASPAASTLLIFQAVFPFLLFAGNDREETVELEISGGTNVAFSPSFEYVDQVLLPTLEGRFHGVHVQRELDGRGWSQGKATRGTVKFTIQPLKRGETLRLKEPERAYSQADLKIEGIDVSMVVPADMQEPLQEALVKDLEELFPAIQVHFRLVQDSGQESRVYVLLVAYSASIRWGRDLLTSQKKKAAKGKGTGAEEVSSKVSQELYEEVAICGVVDEHLQDQLVIYQALADGRTMFPRSNDAEDNDSALEEAMTKMCLGASLHRDEAREPFGEGSMHTKTARWVTAEILPQVAWFDRGRVCQGSAVRVEAPTREE